jgi:hypothetical protein
MREVFLPRADWVLSGSLEGWGNAIIPIFDLVVFLTTPREVRLQRLRARKATHFGADAVAPGGWRHKETEQFIERASRYDDGDREGRSLAKHQAWLAALPLPTIFSCATDAAGNANPLAGRIDHAIGFGASQSGRYLHDYLYLGFNADEAGRTVFEGLMPHVSGAKKTFTNYRFSQPGRSPYQHADMLYPGADFPFTYPVITDRLTGKTDGFLTRCLAAGNCPKVIKTDSEIEFYQQRASLVVTDTEGNALSMPDNIRLFLLSNLQHFSLANAKSEMARTCAFPTNPLNAGPPARALLVALDGWISNGALPPASRYPSRGDGTLVSPAIDDVGFPRIPGFAYPSHMARPTVIKSEEMPPSKGDAYPVFVPKTDADGRDIAGLRLPTLEAPAATHTGWNIRKVGFGEGELCDNIMAP